MSSDHGIRITWNGHATTTVETPDGKIILIDPWLAHNPSTPEDQKQIDKVDLMLISHGHGDHMGDAISIAQRTRPHIISMNEICMYLGSKGVQDCSGGNTGGSQTWEGIRVTMVDAIHSSSIQEGDTTIYAGLPVGFVIRFPDHFTLYHAGDTAVFEGMRLIGRLYEPDVAMLPIGDHYTMGPREAAEAIRLLGVTRVIPMHFGTFPILTGTPADLEKEASDISGLRIITLNPGQSVTQGEITHA
jgi:L-ascorbate metabolism protein UlaG (beta-lactamase superfamily)